MSTLFASLFCDPDWVKRIIAAMAQALESDNFSDAWCQAAARERCEELLANAPEIRRAEAERRLKAKEREDDYKDMAADAKDKYGHDEEYIVEVLRKADGLPYRLLQEAMKLKQAEKAE